MSGHSKWNNIKNRKGAADIKKGKVFSDIGKQIRIAVKEGKSGDPKFNAGLRLALDRARAANMPKENVSRAIDRGLGKSAAGQLSEVVYEGYGPHGIGFLVVAHTDNHQRTASEIRLLFSRAGGSLGSPGSAMYLFHKEGEEYTVALPMEVSDEDHQQQLQDFIDEVRANEDVEDVYCAGVWPEKE